MNAERRFIDRDLHADPELIEIATDWAWGYRGEFEFMLAAQEASRHGLLSLPVARGVLNCMRADPMAARLLPALPRWDGPGDNVRPIRQPARQRQYQRPPEPWRPRAIIELPVRMKHDFVVSGHKSASCYHRVIHGSAHCKWWVDWDRWIEGNQLFIPRKPEFWFKVLCAKSFYGKDASIIRPFESEEAAQAAGFRLCATCRRIKLLTDSDPTS